MAAHRAPSANEGSSDRPSGGYYDDHIGGTEYRADGSWGELRWFQPPTNAEELAELKRRLSRLATEIDLKAAEASALMRSRISNPRPGSKYAEWVSKMGLRLDLKYQAWKITRPFAGISAAAEMMDKSAGEVTRRYFQLMEARPAAARRTGAHWGD